MQNIKIQSGPPNLPSFLQGGTSSFANNNYSTSISSQNPPKQQNNINFNTNTPGNNDNRPNLEELLKNCNVFFDKINKESFKLESVLIPTYPEADYYLKKLNDI